MKKLFILQVAALILACVFAVVFNSHPKVEHPSQLIGAMGLYFSILAFLLLTIRRVMSRAQQ